MEKEKKKEEKGEPKGRVGGCCWFPSIALIFYFRSKMLRSKILVVTPAKQQMWLGKLRKTTMLTSGVSIRGICQTKQPAYGLLLLTVSVFKGASIHPAAQMDTAVSAGAAPGTDANAQQMDGCPAPKHVVTATSVWHGSLSCPASCGSYSQACTDWTSSRHQWCFVRREYI